MSDIVNPRTTDQREIAAWIAEVTRKLNELYNAAVRGPASVTDGAQVLFDGTTGKLVKE